MLAIGFQCDYCKKWDHDNCERRRYNDVDLCKCVVCHDGTHGKAMRRRAKTVVQIPCNGSTYGHSVTESRYGKRVKCHNGNFCGKVSIDDLKQQHMRDTY